ncbi:MAG TPA: hypothetical protein VNT77_04100 [Allosphingosinicella sp.]|nr:hypothetical protein [Allosphingosinicella sp.]
MRDRRTIVMSVLLVLVAVLGGFYLFANRDSGSGGWGMPAGAILLLLLLAGASAGASRRRRIVRDEEERKDG